MKSLFFLTLSSLGDHAHGRKAWDGMTVCYSCEPFYVIEAVGGQEVVLSSRVYDYAWLSRLPQNSGCDEEELRVNIIVTFQ